METYFLSPAPPTPPKKPFNLNCKNLLEKKSHFSCELKLNLYSFSLLKYLKFMTCTELE